MSQEDTTSSRFSSFSSRNLSRTTRDSSTPVLSDEFYSDRELNSFFQDPADLHLTLKFSRATTNRPLANMDRQRPSSLVLMQQQIKNLKQKTQDRTLPIVHLIPRRHTPTSETSSLTSGKFSQHAWSQVTANVKSTAALENFAQDRYSNTPRVEDPVQTVGKRLFVLCIMFTTSSLMVLTSGLLGFFSHFADCKKAFGATLVISFVAVLVVLATSSCAMSYASNTNAIVVFVTKEWASWGSGSRAAVEEFYSCCGLDGSESEECGGRQGISSGLTANRFSFGVASPTATGLTSPIAVASNLPPVVSKETRVTGSPGKSPHVSTSTGKDAGGMQAPASPFGTIQSAKLPASTVVVTTEQGGSKLDPLFSNLPAAIPIADRKRDNPENALEIQHMGPLPVAEAVRESTNSSDPSTTMNGCQDPLIASLTRVLQGAC
ncbi:hypothetical protein HDU98_011374, partial [Podochytrium sp. JEL0797]